MSLDWSSQTGAGSRNGGCGTGAGVDVGGTIGPWLVFQSTRMASEPLARQATNSRPALANWRWHANEIGAENNVKVIGARVLLGPSGWWKSIGHAADERTRFGYASVNLQDRCVCVCVRTLNQCIFANCVRLV